MTHRDGFPRLSARSAWRSDAGHRKPCATPAESLGKPPVRSGRRTAGGRRKALPMSRIARGFPPTRRIACTISMGHYQGPLVLAGRPVRSGPDCPAPWFLRSIEKRPRRLCEGPGTLSRGPPRGRPKARARAVQPLPSSFRLRYPRGSVGETRAKDKGPPWRSPRPTTA